MEQTLVVDRITQLKALADPLRQRILSAFCCAPATTKQIAIRLGEKPTRLYHHVDLLEEAGLLILIETRQNRGTVEKYYQAAARHFVIDHRLLHTAADTGEAPAEAQSTVINMLQSALNEARDSFDRQRIQTSGATQTVMLGQARLQLTESQAQTLIEKLSAWLDTCCDVEEMGDAKPYLLNVALFPLQAGDGSERRSDDDSTRS
jgi:DNA-binding transcriptional ArsR family regulator